MTTLDKYDIAMWRPLPAAEYAAAFAQAAMTGDGTVTTLTTEVETLYDGGSVRLVTYAEMKRIGVPEESNQLPYLMVMYNYEANKANCFISINDLVIE